MLGDSLVNIFGMARIIFIACFAVYDVHVIHIGGKHLVDRSGIEPLTSTMPL